MINELKTYSLVNKWCWVTRWPCAKKVKLDSYLTPYINLTQNVLKTWSKTWNHNIGGKLLAIGLGTPKAKATKLKINVGQYRTQQLLHSQRNDWQDEKAAYIMGENICKPSIWWVNIQNKWNSYYSIAKNKSSDLKDGWKPWIDSFQCQ